MTNDNIDSRKWTSETRQGEIFRLQLFMAEMGLTPDDMQKEAGITARTVANSIYEQKPIGAKFIRALHTHYGVSIDWLISGTGQMLLNSNQVAEAVGNYSINNERTQRIVNFVREWMFYANEDEQAWLETEIKFNLPQYKNYLDNV